MNGTVPYQQIWKYIFKRFSTPESLLLVAEATSHAKTMKHSSRKIFQIHAYLNYSVYSLVVVLKSSINSLLKTYASSVKFAKPVPIATTNVILLGLLSLSVADLSIRMDIFFF